MSIEPKSTAGPHSNPDSLAADWLVQSGIPGGQAGPRRTVQDAILVSLPHPHVFLPLASAAQLRDALTEHLENMGSPTEALDADMSDAERRVRSGVVIDFRDGIPAEPIKAAEAIAHALRRVRPRLTPPTNMAQAADVPVEVRDAYAENSRTIGAVDVHLMTDEEAADVVGDLLNVFPGFPPVDVNGIRYTDSAVRDLKVKAGRHAAKLAAKDAPVVPADAWDRTFTPVDASTRAPIRAKTVRGWTDAQCEGAWNHAQHVGKDGLADRPSGRLYTTLAAPELRRRLNKANGADASR